MGMKALKAIMMLPDNSSMLHSIDRVCASVGPENPTTFRGSFLPST